MLGFIARKPKFETVAEYLPETRRVLVKTLRGEDKFLVSQPYTPPELIQEINGNLQLDKSSSVAVLYTVEWAAELQFAGYKHITVITEELDPVLAKICAGYGFKYALLDKVINTNMKFDAIVGNPPFQNGSTSAGNFVMWPAFLAKSFELLKDDGVMSMIVPQTWAANRADPPSRSQQAALVRKEVLSQGDLTLVNFDVAKYFPKVGSTFSYLVLRKSDKRGKTKVITEDGTYSVKYEKQHWLKTRIIKTKAIQQPVLNLINDGKETGGYREGGKNISSKGKFPIVNTSAQYAKEEYLYSTSEHPYQRVKKVIFSDSGYSKPFYDDGNFGLGHHARAFKVTSKKHAKEVIDYLNSDYLTDLASTIPNTGAVSTLGKLLAVGFFEEQK